MILYNGEIYTMDSGRTVIKNGFVRIEEGKITQVGSSLPEVSYEDIDLGGKMVFPGFIDCHTHMGLADSGIGTEGEDLNEDSDPVTPQLRVIDAINPLDVTFHEAAAAGVTAVVVSPGSSNAIAGQISAIKTVGVRADRMLIKDVGIKFALGENPKMTYLNKDESPVTRMATAALIRETLKKAVRYKEQLEKSADPELDEDEPDYDIKLESLLPLLEGKLKAHFHCHRADDIFTALRISAEFGLKPVLIHCTEGHLIPEELSGCEAVVGPIISDRCKPELANVSLKNLSELRKHGCASAVCTDHGEVPIQYLPLSAALTMRGGTSWYEAIESITRIPAEIAGVSDRIGSLEPGKDGDICVFSQDPLGVLSQPEMVFVDGKQVFTAK